MLQFSKFNIQYKVALFIAVICVFATSCSVPTLENSDCRKARNAAKAFYSFHFGNDFKFTKENLKKREKFLSKELKQNLEKLEESNKDYFTQTDDYPKAFRVGKCEISDSKTIKLEIVFFWSNETRKEQDEIFIEMKKVSENWLINKVAPKK